MKAREVRRRGRLWLQRPGCACTMDRLGDLKPCFYHFSSPGGILKSRNYLLRAWRWLPRGFR